MLSGNYIDGSFGGDKWYENNNTDTKIIGISNETSVGHVLSQKHKEFRKNIGV